jgi:ABC-type transport system substrate-binding protein
VRYWTVDEAQAFLPRLRLLLGVIRRATNLAVSARGNGHAVLPGAPPPAGPAPRDGTDSQATSSQPAPPASGSAPPPGSAPVPGYPPDPGSEPAVAFDVKEALAELEEQGIVLRDPDRGLIDFTALHNGREVLLCWQLGEEELAWWHFPEDGFAGRRPLPLPPEF